MIFKAAAVTAAFIIVSLAPAAAASCDERIANHCPGAPIFAPTAGNAGQPVSAAPAAADAPLAITNGRRTTRSARRHHRYSRSWRYRRGKSMRHAAAARRHARAALARKAAARVHKRRAARDDADDLVGLAVQEADAAERTHGGQALAAAGADTDFAEPRRRRAGAVPSQMRTAALTPIGADMVPSRAFLPTADNTPTTVVATKTVNAAPAAPVRVASAAGPTPAAAAPPQTQTQTASIVSVGGTDITALRAMFLAFGALLLAGTAVRLAIR